MRVRGGWWWIALLASLGCTQGDDIASLQQAVEGSACPAEWFAAAPPNPDWGLPPTLGEVLPIDFPDYDSLAVLFPAPSASLRSLLPQGLSPFEFVPGFGAVGFAFATFGAITAADGSPMDPDRELSMNIPVYDSSLSDGYLPFWPIGFVETSEQMIWVGEAAYGFRPKLLGNVKCHKVPPMGIRCIASADDKLIAKVDFRTDKMTTPYTIGRAVLISIKDGYLVRTVTNEQGDATTNAPGDATVTIQLGEHPLGQILASVGVGMFPSAGAYWAPHAHGSLGPGLCTPLQ